jgi:hypothetical protein
MELSVEAIGAAMLTPEAAKAIEIADRHLAGQSPEKRAALAKDIILAITDGAQRLIDEMFKPRKN